MGSIQLLTCVYLIQFSMGLVFEIVGPTLDELGLVTNSSTDTISLIFSFRSIGYVLGSIVGGAIFSFFVPLISLSCAVFLNSLTIASIGFIRNLHFLNTVFVVNGLTTGIIDVGTNVWILRLFSSKSGPYMMALSTIFSLGTIVAPLYTAPFLREPLTSSSIESRLHTPYLITGLCTFIPFIGLMILLGQQLQLPPFERSFIARATVKQETETETKKVTRSHRIPSPRAGEKALIVVAIMMIMFYSGIEIIYSEYMVPMLNRSKLGISISTASQIKSASNAAYTVGKLISIGITAVLSPYRIILIDSALVIFSTVMLITYFNTSLSAVWVLSVLHGLGTSSLYPCIYPFIETYVAVDYFKGSFFICASGLTAIIYPIFVGSYLKSTPTFVLYLKTIIMIMTIFFTVAINIMGNRLLFLDQQQPTQATEEANDPDEEDNDNNSDHPKTISTH